MTKRKRKRDADPVGYILEDTRIANRDRIFVALVFGDVGGPLSDKELLEKAERHGESWKSAAPTLEEYWRLVEGFAKSIGANPSHRPESWRTLLTRYHVAWFVELVQQEGHLSRGDAIRAAAKAFARSESAIKQDIAFARRSPPNAHWDETKKRAQNAWRGMKTVYFPPDRETVAKQTAKSDATPINAAQLKELRGKIKKADGVSEGRVCKKYGVTRLEDLSATQFGYARKALLNWTAEHGSDARGC